MSVLNKEEFFSRLSAQVGTDTSDSALSFIEDMTDTYNHLQEVANGDGVDWEKKYNELDKAWKERYRRRFFTGESAMPSNADCNDTEEQPSTNITIESLFGSK